jgi:hypothetical protein
MSFETGLPAGMQAVKNQILKYIVNTKKRVQTHPNTYIINPAFKKQTDK